MKVFTVMPKARVYVYSEPIRMSCSFPKLIGLVEDQLKKTLQAGDLYLFANKAQTYLKVLFWSKGGACILAKQLPRGKFSIKLDSDTLTIAGLHSVLDKPDVKRLSAPPKQHSRHHEEPKQPEPLGRMKGV